jgi:hypothetical protein
MTAMRKAVEDELDLQGRGKTKDARTKVGGSAYDLGHGTSSSPPSRRTNTSTLPMLALTCQESASRWV